jgi:hypothetical protein
MKTNRRKKQKEKQGKKKEKKDYGQTIRTLFMFRFGCPFRGEVSREVSVFTAMSKKERKGKEGRGFHKKTHT